MRSLVARNWANERIIESTVALMQVTPALGVVDKANNNIDDALNDIVKDGQVEAMHTGDTSRLFTVAKLPADTQLAGAVIHRDKFV